MIKIGLKWNLRYKNLTSRSSPSLQSFPKMRILILLVLVTLSALPSLSADEIVINRTRQTAGDFSCLPFSNRSTPRFDLESGEISAGALWRFFDAQGSKSIHQLTLCLDLESIDEDASFGLESIELKIEDPTSGELLTDVSLGNDILTVPGYETSSFKPEAKLQLALDYDFMERFSADSDEKISVNFQSNDGAIVPKFAVQSETRGFFSGVRNPSILIGFSVFWFGFFHLLSRFTKPAEILDGNNAVA